MSIVAAPHHLSAMSSCFWTNVDDVVGSAHDVFIVFHHHHGVAHIAEFFQNVDEAIGVA